MYELDNFRERWESSRKFVSFVAHLLYVAEFGLVLPVSKCRKEIESRKPYEGSTDVHVFLTPAKKAVIEVKSKAVTFTDDPESWPFDDVTLYNTNKQCSPYAVVFVSSKVRPTPNPVVVLRDDRWFERPQADRDPERNGLVYPVKAAPREALMRWTDFLEALRAELEPKAS